MNTAPSKDLPVRYIPVGPWLRRPTFVCRPKIYRCVADYHEPTSEDCCKQKLATVFLTDFNNDVWVNESGRKCVRSAGRALQLECDV
jgi:hypothetical protein